MNNGRQAAYPLAPWSTRPAAHLYMERGTMNLRQRLDEIRTLAEKATPGPWAAWRHFVDRQLTVPHTVSPATQGLATCDCDQNAALIAAMRNAIVPLMEVVEAQHRALEALLVEQNGMPKECGHFYECRCAHDAARAALSLMDKEGS